MPIPRLPGGGAVRRFDRPCVSGRGHVDHAIDHEDAAAETWAAAGIEIAGAESADDDRGRRAAATASPKAAAARVTGAGGAAAIGESRHPGEAEVLHSGLVDLFERAVAL